MIVREGNRFERYLQGLCVGSAFLATDGGIWNVVVEPAFRRRGIAQDLMLEILRVARREMHSNVWLKVYGYNYGAIRLYSRLGFRVVDLTYTPGFVHPVPNLVMGMDL